IATIGCFDKVMSQTGHCKHSLYDDSSSEQLCQSWTGEGHYRQQRAAQSVDAEYSTFGKTLSTSCTDEILCEGFDHAATYQARDVGHIDSRESQCRQQDSS